MEKEIHKVRSIKGILRVPSDKSISHRSIILTSMANGISTVRNFLKAGDTLTTVNVYRKLGIKIEEDKGVIKVHGKGLKGFKEPEDVLDMGNSGTTTRLSLGVLAGQKIFAVLTGDESLRKRPMKRVAEPLRQMNALIDGRKGGELLPLSVRGSDLKGIKFFNEKASAQVKSALLIAGLNAEGNTTVEESYKSRDHTEKMLKAMGADIQIKEGNIYSVSVNRTEKLFPVDIEVPADPSSAAFFAAAAAIVPDSEIVLKDVLVNPTRDGFFRKLKEMGADIEYTNVREKTGEPVADIIVRYSPYLKSVKVSKKEIPSMVDEIPVLAIVATQAEGETVITGASELRVKESDRIKAVVENLKKIGIEAVELDDGMIIKGKQKIKGGYVDSFKDHRIAMAFSILGLIAEEGIKIKDADCAYISYPEFFEHLQNVVQK
ncbi:3-phosphoshikimate 1-carboxyvinyltransferase [Persephonella hydrogeniphila]|uniref:3-phosphoshikimate 1-carboxyvinyltransferase n=1 Tax=Persephonella hydrogeniphila TaxID=198703 RepID=A0A285MY68_9AQUI|nr:3-phosphoshikimate 1-carboxyvinyltransferase [Persephonella hydrogeniphila]SNZ02132.1 3-phosphoshikimate 1-carboxyvinyltransferase [Persephonella hydrogeniphila]